MSPRLLTPALLATVFILALYGACGSGDNGLGRSGGGGELDTGQYDFGDETGLECDTCDTGEPGPEDCPRNSGWPCSCDVLGEDCDDGATCLYVSSVSSGDLGICTHECEDGDCDATSFDGTATCALETEDEGDSYCALYCDDEDDCPSDQDCIAASDTVAICHP